MRVFLRKSDNKTLKRFREYGGFLKIFLSINIKKLQNHFNASQNASHALLLNSLAMVTNEGSIA